jgi:hypothetical protein
MKPGAQLITVELPQKLVFEIDKRRSRRFRFGAFTKPSAICQIQVTVVDTNTTLTQVLTYRPGEKTTAIGIARYIQRYWKYKKYKTGDIELTVNTYLNSISVDNTNLTLIDEYIDFDIRNGDLYY